MSRRRSGDGSSGIAAPVRLSVGLYRRLLLLFPRGFRAEAANEMTEVFEQLATEHWRRSSIGGLGLLWLRTLKDLMRHGLAERFRDRSARPPASSRRLEPLGQELRYALRSLRRSPGLAVAVLATLGLGVGATSVIVAVFDGVLRRPLPFADSERVVALCETHERVGDFCVASPPNAADWAASSRTLETIGLARAWPFAERTEDGLRGRQAGIASPGWFEVYGTKPVLGRLLRDEDLLPGSNRVAVLTHSFWQRRFGGELDIVGETLLLDDEVFSVIGVLSADAWFHDFGWADVWLPYTAIQDDVGNRSWRGFVVLGRRAAGASLEAVRSEMQTLRTALAAAHPESNGDWGIEVVSLQERLTGPVRPVLRLFLLAVALVLLVACLNVANLLLVRAAGRHRELAVRTALGAGRRDLLRQSLVESLLLAVGGGALGLILAALGLRALLLAAPADLPRLEEIRIDLQIVLITLAVATAAALLSGLAPALQVARSDLGETLRRRRLASPGDWRLRRTLVVVELSLAMLLTLGAGLAGRGLLQLTGWQPGFERHDLYLTWASLTSAGSGGEAAQRFHRAARELEALPGIESVGLASAGPLFGGVETALAQVAGRPESEAISVRWFDVGPRYFETLQIPVLRGRGLTDADVSGSAPVALVNESLARRLWEGAAVGQRVTVYDTTMEVVGVVADVPSRRLDRPVAPEIYWPQQQRPRLASFFVLRSSSFEGVRELVRARLDEIDPDLVSGSFRSFPDLESRSLVTPRFHASLVGLFATLALVLAAVGVYGVLSYSVASRQQELGIRMAVGASPGVVVADILRSGLTLALLGALLGLAGTLALSRLLETLLYGFPATDPSTFATITLFFLAVALAACWLPARRASRLDPLQALRVE